MNKEPIQVAICGTDDSITETIKAISERDERDIVLVEDTQPPPTLDDTDTNYYDTYGLRPNSYEYYFTKKGKYAERSRRIKQVRIPETMTRNQKKRRNRKLKKK